MNTCATGHPTDGAVKPCCEFHPKPVCRRCWERLLSERHPTTNIVQLDDVPDAEARCDFCYHPEPIREYPARDFTIPSVRGYPDYGSRGGWVACQKCAELLDGGGYDTILNRAVYWYRKRNKRPTGWSEVEWESTVYDFIARLHGAFVANRIGEGRPITWQPSGRSTAAT